MSSIDVNSVLAQIRTLSAQAQAQTSRLNAPAVDTNSETQGGGFTSMVRDGVDRVNTMQSDAASLQQRFELGDPNVDLATVMLASSKASVSFRGMVEVRNRLVNAYQEIMNMPV
jgi:flagellar hook-basal body complex protein FliE